MELYKETNYQTSSFARIPKDWNRARLEDVIDSFQTGIWGGEPVQGKKSFPVIRSTEITYDGRIDPSSAAWRDIPERKIEKYMLQDGDILLVASSGSSHLIGRAAIYKQFESNQTFLFSNFMIRIRPADINPAFLYYCLRSSQYHEYLKQLQQTSTGLRNLPRKEILLFELPFPSRIEQDNIVYVLDIIDKLIQQTDSIIRKTQELKKGLMQELLTKGIGHKEFKYSEELGCEIPKEWELRSVEDICDVNKDTLNNGTEVDYEFLYIDIGSVAYAGAKPTIQQLAFRDAPSRARRRVKKDDILVSTVRPNLRAFTYINDDLDNLICSTGYAVLSTKQVACSKFVYQFILSEYFLNQLVPMGSSYPAVTSKQVGRVKIPLPKLDEQQKIAKILTSIDEQIETEMLTKEKLEKLKKGLMQILLTGQVRIKVN
jgi:type I restriction enzyme S subunit